ncbi:Carbohydrate binding domain (family 17/28) [Natronincola peptidivorans]|uniref:Carbohydrate binding domain (Family 17/28) n=1 Tax=Natronincola peptidivorans TaxID=426128 RepID=A0A1I0EIY9_9FIRM|nr:carbohydrate-binding domain-containing protein [Natronincola peptidivorans]SET45120.1 Carbohydrate binding domain (family 17/28) [Natronincola peptidivorans]
MCKKRALPFLIIITMLLSFFPFMVAGAETDDGTKENFSEVIWDFDDGTTQGFDVNADSPVKNVTLSNDNNSLKIEGLSASNDISEGNYWANLRISADGWKKTQDILGAETLTMDVIAAAPATVSIAAVPQSPASMWANPRRAVIVRESDFTQQSDGTYKALLTINTDDAPNFNAIAEDADDSKMISIILFIGTKDADVIYLDNITVNGARKMIDNPGTHDPLGAPTIKPPIAGDSSVHLEWNGVEGAKGFNVYSTTTSGSYSTAMWKE